MKHRPHIPFRYVFLAVVYMPFGLTLLAFISMGISTLYPHSGTPVVLLIGFAATVALTGLALWAFRGRIAEDINRVNDPAAHATACRKCGYDLRPFSVYVKTCPECGEINQRPW